MRKLNNLQKSSFLTSNKRDFLLEHTADNVVDLDSDVDENMEFNLEEQKFKKIQSTRLQNHFVDDFERQID